MERLGSACNKMSLLSYTTEAPEFRTISEIQKMLSEGKATAILQEFNGAGDVEAISFRTKSEFGEMYFRLPANVMAVDATLKQQCKEGKISRKYANDSRHSRRVAWRIIRHWIEAQLALITVGMAKPEEVFLPYAQDSSGKTVFENLRDKKFSGFALKDADRT